MPDTAHAPSARRAAARLAALAALATVVACSDPDAGTSNSEETAAPAEPAAKVRITPEDGATKVRPDLPVVVKADDGATLTDVAVDIGGRKDAGADEMTGSFTKDKTEWRSDWTLHPGSDVTVTATATTPDDEETEVVSEFATREATKGRRLELKSNFPSSGDTVGVGMPVIVNFDLPVENKERVESAMEVTSEQPAEGAWNWFGDKTAVFRPKEYWEPNQKVTVDMRLAGVPAAKGAYGTKNHQLSFEVGRSQISTIDSDTKRMTVERDGEQVKDFPTSIGKASTRAYTTTSGTHLTMEKYDRLTMDSATVGVPKGHPDYYKLEVDYAVRFSNSGEFTHAAPWNGSLGQANLTHGCPNLAVADAKWFYDNSVMGDPLIVENTDRELEVDNGWGYWQRSWDEWLNESATGEADDTSKAGTPGSPHGG
ncbi:lipoprotein-anchoring transpeptidase ErfK/SrfK [Murinocardiopsis flavida]|uniref:Lipoprotein-anchoring transpeptidase ErfK/SrfK n=1 Tax=Murinocardiopsis flavida TaxID=645275 RepID=A0A2P8DKI1_9ACTN|nr:Ig-like domain-containing protein [Murinocardiopsis flavida]PSK97723.1 lipoprotein-anchoring transpeptidase ErfK/SrfK [Murinocardiopsis flavida]